jgi:urea transport system permease protein
VPSVGPIDPSRVIAAVALGLLNAFVEYASEASIAKALLLVAIVAFLQFRPQGLFVRRTRAVA